jgi:superfamily II RNA helicase
VSVLTAFEEQLQFPLDGFQKEAMAVIESGQSVVVCAPTGAGKTIIAEFAAQMALERGKKIFYTTPLKALSNQKLFDFKALYGEQNVGLLTGDMSLNREAMIVVMTTEVFRNMLYGVHEDSTLMDQVGYVVLDECHYMNDADRGTVWEESIIYCLESIQIIALSATVANAQELTDWINEVHHDTRLISSDFRPVPLRFSYYNRETLLPLFEAPGRMNKKLKFDQKGNRFSKDQKQFRPNLLIREMQERQMLPAIFFTFSRKGCDRNLSDTKTLRLLNDLERRQINQKVDEFVAQNPFIANSPYLPAIRNGFASHHAGLLPALKILVESLFQMGLIKVVFATETLAAGINMPARSTVITAISKRTNDGHRVLTASEFLQMSGRAGRRGLDEVGYVVLVSTPFQGASDAALLASSPADPLNSQFTPTYGMVLNLLQRHTMEEARFLISKSFGQFTAERRLGPILNEVTKRSAELNHYLNFECPAEVDDKGFHGYLKSRQMSYDSKKQLQILQSQVKRYGNEPGLQEALTKERAKLDNLAKTLNSSPCDGCHLLKDHQRNEERVHRLQKQLKYLNQNLDTERDVYWRTFFNLSELLKHLNHLTPEGKPTPLGWVTSQIRAENELYLSELIHHGVLETESPESLAAVMCALVNDSTRDNLFVRFSLSPECRGLLTDIEKHRKRLDKLQKQYRIDTPLLLNPIASPLVEAWCQQLPWQKLIQETNLDEGDLVRLLRRTADLLRQLSRISAIPEALSKKAKEAYILLYRDPIQEIDWVDSALPNAETNEAKEVLKKDFQPGLSPLNQAADEGSD